MVPKYDCYLSEKKEYLFENKKSFVETESSSTNFYSAGSIKSMYPSTLIYNVYVSFLKFIVSTDVCDTRIFVLLS